MVSQDDPRFSHFAVFQAGDIYFYAVRGGTVKRFQSERSVNAMKRVAPEIIIFCLGGNDIDGTDAHPLRVGMDLFQLASNLKNNIHGLRRVGFCQVVERRGGDIYRWRKVGPRCRKVGPRCRTMINEFLQAGTQRVSAFKIRDFQA